LGGGGCGLDLSGSGYGKVADFRDDSNGLEGYIMRGISWMAKELLASLEGLCSMKLFGKNDNNNNNNNNNRQIGKSWI
jgi:hypothetical protein